MEQEGTIKMKFRKRPVVINAERFDGTEERASELAAKYPGAVIVKHWPGQIFSLDIRTLEGMMRASSGDWIITGVNGEHYPCKPDIFEKTYEPVTEEERV